MRQYHLIMIFILFLSISYGQKIKVLNVGTFHMAGTTDARKVEFDVNDKNRIEETNEIARMLAQFKPTVICVEVVPSENEGINLDYSKFITMTLITRLITKEKLNLLPIMLVNLHV